MHIKSIVYRYFYLIELNLASQVNYCYFISTQRYTKKWLYLLYSNGWTSHLNPLDCYLSCGKTVFKLSFKGCLTYFKILHFFRALEERKWNKLPSYLRFQVHFRFNHWSQLHLEFLDVILSANLRSQVVSNTVL